MQAATIKLFLPNGEATGIRTAEKWLEMRGWNWNPKRGKR